MSSELKNVFLQEGRNYNSWNAYARTKTAGILFAVAIADNFGNKGVTSFAVDPGSNFWTEASDVHPCAVLT